MPVEVLSRLGRPIAPRDWFAALQAISVVVFEYHAALAYAMPRQASHFEVPVFGASFP